MNDPDDPRIYQGHLPEHNWSNKKSGHRNVQSYGQINRHKMAKRRGKALLVTGKVGVGATSAATSFMGMNTGVVAVAGALAAGTAVSATGVGLAAASAAFMITQTALNANSLRKTLDHIGDLNEIQKNIGAYMECMPTGNAEDAGIYHKFIAAQVLPYIIAQKKAKAIKKGANMVPVAGMLATVTYSIARKLKKNNVGQKRSFYANVLGDHLITCDCALAMAIVEALMGSSWDMQQLMLMDLGDVTPILSEKLKSA